MGAKGKRRREKNYKAAHGGYTVLPPPPKPSFIDALPAKLRTIMSLTSSSPGSGKSSTDFKQSKKKVDDGNEKKLHTNDESVFKTSGIKTGDNDEEDDIGQVIVPQESDFNDEIVSSSTKHEKKKKKKKRKRKQVKDLRFDEAEILGIGSKRKERKKKYLEERKKKHKKPKTEDILEFPRHEQIKFGDIVAAPPKLVVPKAIKTAQDASKERLRLQAVDSYRKRKGWASRPGLHLPSPVTTAPMI